MLPDSKPPQDVLDLVNEYRQNPDTRELVIYDNMFFLYEQTIEKSDDPFRPIRVMRGPFIRRAYWRDAAGISQEMMKARLGLR